MGIFPEIDKIGPHRHVINKMSTEKAAHKEMATTFLRLAASGKIREAFAKLVALGFRHHNPYFKGDADSLLRAIEESDAQNPNRTLEIQRAVAEGDLVAVHSRVKLKPESPGIAVVHIFRFEGDRIVELWDIGQPVPENSPNENGMF